jgi:adenine-specific DNA-methyltransferase
MKDEFYLTPDKVTQEQIKLFENNIKDDRTPEDLLTQVILNLGLKLDLRIEEKDMCGNKIFDVDDGELLACFDDNVSIDIIEEIAKINPRQVVFRDSSFETDQDKVNFEERLKRLSAGTKFNVL